MVKLEEKISYEDYKRVSNRLIEDSFKHGEFKELMGDYLKKELKKYENIPVVVNGKYKTL